MKNAKQQELSQDELNRVQGGVNYSRDDLTDPPEPKAVRKKFQSAGISLNEGQLAGIRGGSVLPATGKPGVRIPVRGDLRSDRQKQDWIEG